MKIIVMQIITWYLSLHTVHSAIIGDVQMDHGLEDSAEARMNRSRGRFGTTPMRPECRPGESNLAADGCNTCFCFHGKWACTLKACHRGYSEPECKNGESEMFDCNVCWCYGGQWLCTWAAGCISTEPECKNGESKMMDCNVCWCSGGQWLCTWAAGCISTEPECKNGESEMFDCNVCWCYSGRWSCTWAAGCISTDFRRNELIKKQLGEKARIEMKNPRGRHSGGNKASPIGRQVTEPKCKTGERKIMDCKQCWCSGGQWMCTLACIHSDLSFDEIIKKQLGEKEWNELKNPSGRQRGDDVHPSGSLRSPHPIPYPPNRRIGNRGLPMKPNRRIGNRGLPRNPNRKFMKKMQKEKWGVTDQMGWPVNK